MTSTPTPTRAPMLLKASALLIVLALHLFHPAGLAASLPLSLLVLGGTWLAEATLAGGKSWAEVGAALTGPSTMPFYLGVLVFNGAVAMHLPSPAAGAGAVGSGSPPAKFVSLPKNNAPIPGPAQGGCGSSCGGSGGCGSGGGCSSSGGCGGGCGGGKAAGGAANVARSGTAPKPVAKQASRMGAPASNTPASSPQLAAGGRVIPPPATGPAAITSAQSAAIAQLRAQRLASAEPPPSGAAREPASPPAAAVAAATPPAPPPLLMAPAAKPAPVAPATPAASPAAP